MESKAGRALYKMYNKEKIKIQYPKVKTKKPKKKSPKPPKKHKKFNFIRKKSENKNFNIQKKKNIKEIEKSIEKIK